MKFTKYALASAVALGLAGAAWADGDPLVADGLDNWGNLAVKPGTGVNYQGGDGSTSGAVWFGNPEDTTVTAYEGSDVGQYAGTATPPATEAFPGGIGLAPNFLKVSQSSVLWRVLKEYTYKYGEGDEAPQGWDDLQEDVKVAVGDGLFVDTLVQFTPSEEAPDVVTGSKLIVWMDVNSNLCVTAAKIITEGDETGTIQETHFVTDKGIKPNTWYRLTVKSYDTVLTDGATRNVHAFKVLINGTPVASDNAIAGDDEFAYFPLVNYDLADDIAAGKVFFSMSDEGEASLAAVGFRGEGLVDSIVVTDEDPIPTEVAPSGIDFTLTWGEGVSAVWYAINDADPVSATKDGSIKLPDGATIEITADPAAWYAINAASIPAQADIENGETYEITATIAANAAAAGVSDAGLADWTPAEVMAAFGDVSPEDVNDAKQPYLDYQFGQQLGKLAAAPSLEIIGIAQNATNSTLWDITVQVVAGETALSIDDGSKSTMRASLQVIASDTIAGLASADPAEYDLAFDETATDLTISVPAAEGQFFKAAIVYTDAKPTVTPAVNQEPEEQSGNDNP